jgi:hypothetical protein
MINSPNFRKFIEEILGLKYVSDVEKDYKRIYKKIGKAAKKLINIRNNIHKIKFNDHLKLMIGKGDAWKKVLIYIYSIIERKRTNEIKVRELEMSLEVNRKTITKDLLPRVLERKLIRYKKKHRNAFIYELTKTGKLQYKEIISDWNINHNREFESFMNNLHNAIEKVF